MEMRKRNIFLEKYVDMNIVDMMSQKEYRKRYAAVFMFH
jgi:hypothetical protein